MFGRKKKPKYDITFNPWTEIEHEHDWLPVMNGTEENCGLCMIRRPVVKKLETEK